jgi:hypothetical protein
MLSKHQSNDIPQEKVFNFYVISLNEEYSKKVLKS